MRNNNYETILHAAARRKDEGFIKLILDWKDPKTNETIQINAFNNNNRTALNNLIESSRVSFYEREDSVDEEGLKLIKLFLKNGAKSHYTFEDWKAGRTQQQLQLFSNRGSGSEQTLVRTHVLQPINAAAQVKNF